MCIRDRVLKELKTFVNTGDTLDAVVITIPASFDTIQSNATKEAGIQAGFKQVVLLQEPIAASLAYANMKKEREMKEGQWSVSYTHLRAHETVLDLVCRLLLEKKKDLTDD